MTSAQTTPHWYLSNETSQELKEAIKKDISNLDLDLAKDVIELKSLLFIARLFQTSSIRTEILKRSTSVSEFLSQMIPCTFRSCVIHVTGYENLLEETTEDRDRYRNSTAVDSEIAYLLDIVEESVDLNFGHELLPNDVGLVLCEYFHLSDVEKSITECISYLAASEHFENIIDTDLIKSFSDTCKILSIGLNIPLKNINQALATSAPLAKFGLIEIDTGYHFSDVLKLQTNQRIFDYFFKGSLDKEELDTWVAPQAPTSKTSITDYFYMKSELAAVSNLLTGHASGLLKKPPQILLWGEPGTGKTEFARLCIQTNYSRCLEVPFKEGDSLLSGEERLQAYHRVAHIVGDRLDAALIFDEIEDIISRKNNQKDSKKAMLNRSIEEPALPVIWISNSLENFDVSYLRRFDFIVKFGHLDKKDAKKIVHTHAKGLKLTNTWVEDLCIQYKLVPSVITDTLSTVRLLGLSGKQAEKFIELKIDQFDQGKLSLNPWLSRRRKNTNDKSKNSASEIKYRPELSNTSVCLSELSRLLKKQSDAKLIFYGPPGTGKTAFANHLGSQIKRKTQYINASELLNMFVGGTEEKIRDLFQAAEDMGHIVVIDEADSILRSRSEAHRSWEVTQVNQFLSSVEQFKGICIICTNHESSLDPALYRRFDLKIHFGYLHIDQSVELFHELVKKLDFTIDDEEIVRTRLTKLTKLVPGYFNLLARKAKFSTADNDPETLVSMLAEEQQWTSPEPKQIGFIH